MESNASETIKISVVDDHQLFRQGVINLIHKIDPRFEVISDAANGKEFLEQYNSGISPDIIIVDINMPVMDGHKTTMRIREMDKKVAILALTMRDDEATLIRLLKAGVSGYLNKDVEPAELKTALTSLAEKGTYYNDFVAGKLVSAIRVNDKQQEISHDFTAQEVQFIELSCSEDTYKVIADKMNLSIKTIDGYRGKVFEKLKVNSRVGLVMYAIKNNLVAVDQLE